MPAVGLKSASSTGRVRLAKYQVVSVKDVDVHNTKGVWCCGMSFIEVVEVAQCLIQSYLAANIACPKIKWQVVVDWLWLWFSLRTELNACQQHFGWQITVVP
jgi:hypothetical protein